MKRAMTLVTNLLTKLGMNSAETNCIGYFYQPTPPEEE